ncbi:MAG: Bax inhibitor-1/YccA family protein [Actinobacteria bacterium]|nr:Bax inhibitor-1/YccA family protein [Actinomycetota bacterium]
MPNPVFNEKKFEEASAGWGAPKAGQHIATQPVTDGPVTSWQKSMTINGTISASLVLLILLLVSASFGWNAATGPTTVEGVDTYSFPPMAMMGIVVGFAAVFAAMFKPNLAKIFGPVYAICYGFAVGAISKGYETLYDGIVLQAVLATASVFTVMLVLYRTRIIKVTNKFRRNVIFATLGVMVLYVGSFIFSLFGGSLPFLNGDNMLLSILFSVFVCGLAAMNLALDFDFIERGANMGLPKAYEWVAALGLVVTLVWLYLELLRLLSYLRN